MTADPLPSPFQLRDLQSAQSDREHPGHRISNFSGDFTTWPSAVGPEAMERFDEWFPHFAMRGL
jgi:hypothetical protein